MASLKSSRSALCDFTIHLTPPNLARYRQRVRLIGASKQFDGEVVGVSDRRAENGKDGSASYYLGVVSYAAAVGSTPPACRAIGAKGRGCGFQPG